MSLSVDPHHGTPQQPPLARPDQWIVGQARVAWNQSQDVDDETHEWTCCRSMMMMMMPCMPPQ
jgi:hypothetical protein